MANQPTTKLPKGRTLAEFSPLKRAEERLLRHAADGTPAVLGDMPPSHGTSENTVRAAFVRFLVLGGDLQAPVHEKGIRLVSAWIEGELDLECAATTGGLCLIACHFEAPLNLVDATISGALVLDRSWLPGLCGDRLEVTGSLLLRNAFMACGIVRLINAKISGNFACSGQFFGNSGSSIIAEQIQVGGGVSLASGFVAYGEVSFMGSRILGTLDCKGGVFLNRAGNAIMANGVEIAGGVVMTLGFRAVGTVSFLGAKVGGDLDCRGGHFCGVEGHAFLLDGASIGGAVFIGESFVAFGEVRLVGAALGGDLDCSGGQFYSPNRQALIAERIVAVGEVYFRSPFVARGVVNLVGADLKGSVLFDGSFLNEGEVSLHAERLSVRGALVFGSSFKSSGMVNLLGAHASALHDNEESWPSAIILDGFVYDTLLHDSPATGKARILWLDRQPSDYVAAAKAGRQFRPQPWQQLRKVLREMGHYEAAREVGIEFEKRKRRCGLVGGKVQNPASEAEAEWSAVYGQLARLLHRGYGFLVDYGYRPLKLALPATLIWLLCGLFFTMAAWNGGFAPASPAIFAKQEHSKCVSPPTKTWAKCVPAAYPQFYPFVYSLNVLLPVGDLGQEAAWRPEDTTWAGWLIQFVVWFETLFGWMSSLLLVAVVSVLVKRDE